MPIEAEQNFAFAHTANGGFVKTNSPKPAITPADGKKSPGAKEIFPIFFAIISDGALPGESNLLNISAEFSPELKFSRNILPQRGDIRITSSRVSEDLARQLRVGAVSMKQAISDLDGWLQKFKGQRVAVTSPVAFYHLLYHMMKNLDKLPVALNPIDPASFVAGSQGNLKKRTILKEKDPEKVLQARIRMVSEAKNHIKNFAW